ncbi:MAG TPA: hypothetical protein VHL53_09080, partial [Acidimicrobiia bacterium]|nr:hypothetical protein [Acidimicrobiia bacterium]
IEEAEESLAVAQGERDAAYAHFAKLAPGRSPSDVEEVIAGLDAQRTARLEAEAAAEAEAEPAPEPVVVEPEPTVAVPAAAAEWWFGGDRRQGAEPAAPAPQPAAPAAPGPAGPPSPVRALAERLSAEGREALARIEAQLAALERVELAKRSLEWHEQHSTGETPAKG